MAEKGETNNPDNSLDSSIVLHLLLNRISKLDITKRTFNVIRALILFSLIEKNLTINQISRATSINWKSVENHLTYLLGKGLVREVHSSEYVRIVELTDKGLEVALKLKERLTRSLIENKDEALFDVLNQNHLK